jgi:hypothetical protein
MDNLPDNVCTRYQVIPYPHVSVKGIMWRDGLIVNYIEWRHEYRKTSWLFEDTPIRGRIGMSLLRILVINRWDPPDPMIGWTRISLASDKAHIYLISLLSPIGTIVSYLVDRPYTCILYTFTLLIIYLLTILLLDRPYIG